jgi:alpha-mannosidase
MNDSALTILAARETPYFGRIPGSRELGQWIMVQLHNTSGHTQRATVTVRSSGRSARIGLRVGAGVQEYRCYAPLLWPESGPDQSALLTLATQTGRQTTRTAVGGHRPWKIYLLSDTCSDYTWGYSTELKYLSDDVSLTESELAVLEATISDKEPNRNRYNFAVANELRFFQQNQPAEQTAKLFQRIREGYFSFSPIPNMALSCSQGVEELIRQLYMAAGWGRDHDVPIRYANHQETPTITWAMASVLAGSGIPYLVKGLLPFDAPWAARLAEPPIFLWEGPDGKRVLYRRYNHHYNEGRFVLEELKTMIEHVEGRLIPEYEGYGSAYPFDLIGLVGCYGDLHPDTADLVRKKALHVAQFNNQGWEYPRIINASHEIFWEEVERQIARGRRPPVFRGDYGTGWEVWLVSLAQLFARWRALQEAGPTADRLFAIAGRLSPAWRRDQQRALAEGWQCLINLGDHAWNGADRENRKLNLRLREGWAESGSLSFSRVIGGGLERIASSVPCPAEGGFLVMNTLGWERTGPVRLPVEQLPKHVVVRDTGGMVVPHQVAGENGREWLYLVAQRVPSLGYRTYTLSRATDPARSVEAPVRVGDAALENRFYRIKVDRDTGAIESLHSKALEREMVGARVAGGLHRWGYRLDGVDQKIEGVEILPGSCGPVFGELIITGRTPQVSVTTRLRIYADLDRIDFSNTVRKAPTQRREELHFYFPLDLPDCQYRHEAPGAVISPGEISRGGEQLPGAGQAYNAVRHSSDVFGAAGGMTLSQVESGFVLFGHRTEQEDPVEPDRSSSTLVSLALSNLINYAEVNRDQGGASDFVFRYALRFYRTYNPQDSVRFGWEHANEMYARFLAPGGQPSIALPAGVHSFLEVHGQSLILVNLKTAEAFPERGVVVRLWNVGAKPGRGVLRFPGPWKVASARATDLLERVQGPLAVKEGAVQLTVPGRGFATALVLLK